MTQLPSGEWVPAKPIRYWRFWTSLKEAWRVFTGKAEAFIWPEDEQGNQK
jgi:hypothetical protein